MTELIFPTEPETPIESDTTCVLFEPQSGEIRHTHRVVTLRGGRRPDEAEIESRARERFVEAVKDAPEVKALLVDSGALDAPGLLSVEITTGAIVSRPLPDVGPLSRPSGPTNG